MRYRSLIVLLLCAALVACSQSPALPNETEPIIAPEPTPSATPAANLADAWVTLTLSGSLRSLPVREAPSSGAAVLGTLIDGTKVKLEDSAAGEWSAVWVELPSGTLIGYVPTVYLSLTPPQVGAAAAPAEPEAAVETDLFNDIGRNTSISSPRIVIHKEARRLTLYDGETPMARFRIGLGNAPVGHKEKEGDNRTPEGEYYLCSRNDNSRYYMSVGISYPGADDADAGLASGIITEAEAKAIKNAIADKSRPPWNTPLGGEIMIHGEGSQSDWTAGCIALDNADMDVIWKHTKNRIPVSILP